ncbi:MAG: NUDIX hydrolase, partial [Chloroflexales bacterium]|nr:NUDIX hydrolase [Chloroflexales bacterium]
MAQKNAHCSYCGAPFAAAAPWPRRCAACGNTSYLNPLPVAVVLVPVGGGVLLVRRAIPPQQGTLALPG